MTYEGRHCIPVDSTEPFTVVVEAGGVRLSRPRLVITSSDPSVADVTPGLDSVRGKKAGLDTLTIRLESSILTDAAVTHAETLRVRQSASSC